MVIIEPEIILSTEPYTVTGVFRIWGDVRENRKDKLIREFENCENRTGQMSVRSEELRRELVLRLVWGAGDPRDFDGGRGCSQQRPCVSLVKRVEVCSRR